MNNDKNTVLIFITDNAGGHLTEAIEQYKVLYPEDDTPHLLDVYIEPPVLGVEATQLVFVFEKPIHYE